MPISTRRARTTSATRFRHRDGKQGAIGVVQIAGLIARRIVCWTKEGQAMAAGERIGMIRFGSRVDVYLPAGTVPLVSEGQTSLAGETVHRGSRSPTHNAFISCRLGANEFNSTFVLWIAVTVNAH